MLPPDLARLGDDLFTAARRSADRRARRRRVAVAALTGALAFAALTPAHLGPALRVPATLADEGFAAPGCDHPRGARFTMAACEGPMVLRRPEAQH